MSIVRGSIERKITGFWLKAEWGILTKLTKQDLCCDWATQVEDSSQG